MSVVPIMRLVLPSALTLTIATDVVGEIEALKPMATPRPRRTVPLPRSNGAVQFMRVATASSTSAMAASFIAVPLACGRPSRRMFLRRNSTGSMPSSRAIRSVWLS